ncbi:helix-turn-helix domain-containing protein [Flavobacterium ponti]|uniref:Helix-turn-helix domain-containing protein n=1 Tax=Flavobacterium ponti TaxID=665133 RepID=A0ABV9P754_9FLAO
MTTISINEFYKEIFKDKCPLTELFFNEQSNEDIGHFNVFNIAEMNSTCKGKLVMPYNRRTYYKISLINGHNIVDYADKQIEIKQKAILFASPRIPYRYTPQNENQSGYFCVFTADFMDISKTALNIDTLPIFSNQSDFVYQISDEQYETIEHIFLKINDEIQSDYAFKYDLLRNYVMELIHTGQKLKPIEGQKENHNASSRISSLFIELLERQFPIESINQELQLRTAKEYAENLRIHVNHLNKVLKEVTGKTTTEIIKHRITQEAKILLKQTDWNISEIAICLGFDEVAHFSNFFKKQVNSSPLQFREN